MEQLKNRIVEWIKEWFESNGQGCNAVIGISGGKDSSIVAALCVEALGKDCIFLAGVTAGAGQPRLGRAKASTQEQS